MKIQEKFKKSTRMIFWLTFLFVPLITNAGITANKCSSAGYTVATINGVSTGDKGAQDNMTALAEHVGVDYHGEKINYQYFLNPSHLGGAGDVAMALVQMADENIKDYDLTEILSDASQKVATQKLLLVAHSQGNFYANGVYRAVVNKVGGLPVQSIGIYAVATPASKVEGDGMHLISATDNMIVGYVGGILRKNILAPNASIPEFDHPSLSFDYGHDFRDAYLQYLPDRIVKEVKQSLDKLSVDRSRDENIPCIDPPELTLGHKFEGVLLGSADNVFNSVFATTAFASNVGQTIARVTVSTMTDLAQSAIHSAGALASSAAAGISSLFANSTNVQNNTASVILTDAPAASVVPAGPPAVPPQPTAIVGSGPSAPAPSSNNTVPVPAPSVIATSTQNQTPATSSVKIVLSVVSSADLGGATAPVTPTVTNDATVPVVAPHQSGINPISPNNTTFSTSTATFSGTYNNSATFNTIVFELKNTSLDTATSTISHSIATTTGENLSYAETATFVGEGNWQYRVRLEDSVNASSTPWSSLLYFTYTAPRKLIKTVYSQPYIGAPVNVGSTEQALSKHGFGDVHPVEDVYSIRIKKASDFDCQKDISIGQIDSGSNPLGAKIVQFDFASAVSDGPYCEYHFTDAYHGPFISSSGLPINEIYFGTKNPEDYLDGSVSNDGVSTNEHHVSIMTGGFAFQLCGIDGCDGEFKLPPAPPVLSSAKVITSYSVSIGADVIQGIIDESTHLIKLTVPFGTDIHALVPTIAVSDHAALGPASGIPQDFIYPILYGVTAEDGSFLEYTAILTISPDTAPPVDQNS